MREFLIPPCPECAGPHLRLEFTCADCATHMEVLDPKPFIESNTHEVPDA